MNRKSGAVSTYRPSFDGKTHRGYGANSRTNTQTMTEAAEEGAISMQSEVQRRDLPEPPPNYRGMIYDVTLNDSVDAEGLDRLAKNDASYSEFERGRIERRREENERAVSVSKDVSGGSSCNINGIERLIDGLSSKSFTSEDMLLCAMILLMLSSDSDDDILMVLVLMMLL